MAETPDQKDRRVDRDLSTVAKILAGAYVAVAGLGTSVGLSQDALLAAVNNHRWLYVWIAVFATLAVALSIVSLFQNSDKKGNRKQAWLLSVGFIAYLIALLLAICGVASTATGNGRPSITDLSVKPNSMVEVSFTVHAVGVKKKDMIIAQVEGFEDKKPIGVDPQYRALLRPDDTGEVNQKVHFIYKRREKENRLTIRVRPDHEGIDGADCQPSEATDKLGCATIMLPPLR
ncbi:hypothetical protein ACWCPI_35740 [Streptomyces sp. NPDC001920]